MMKGVAEFDSMNFIPRLFKSSQHILSRIWSSLVNPLFAYPVKLDVTETGSYGGSRYTKVPLFTRARTFA